MKDFLLYNQKYNTVLVIVGILLLGIFAHLIYLELRLRKLEKEEETSEE